MKDEIERLGKVWSSIKSELSDVMSLKKNLEAKDSSQALSKLEAELESEKSRKDSLLRQYATGRATREDLETILSKFDAISKSIKNEEEIIEATEDLKRELSQKIFTLNPREIAARYGYWRTVAVELKKDIVDVEDKVFLVWAALLKSGANNYGSFLATFIPEPPPNKIAELQQMLDKKYSVK